MTGEAELIYNKQEIEGALPRLDTGWLDRCLDESIHFVMPDRSMERFFRLKRGRLVSERLGRKITSVNVFGAGKASAAFATSFARMFSEVERCELNGPAAFSGRHVMVRECSHPLPDARTVANSTSMLAASLESDREDEIVFLLSGGASSMFAIPLEPSDLAEKRLITEALVTAGASISELNCVRRHISSVKGGRYAAALHPRHLTTLMISDVPTGKPEDIGSGPTSPDVTTCMDALRVLRKYRLKGRLSARTRRCLEERRMESVKRGDHRLRKSARFVIADNGDAVRRFAHCSTASGVRAVVSRSVVSGSPGNAARSIIAEGRRSVIGRGVLVAGGETALSITTTARGGRCQQFAMLGSQLLRSGELLIAAGTDGRDGNSRFAGAIGAPGDADARRYAENFEGERFFLERGTGIITGDTGTNVSDLYIYCRL